jgi:hypothetical protein
MHILWKSIEIHEKRHENHNSQSFIIFVTSLSNALQKTHVSYSDCVIINRQNRIRGLNAFTHAFQIHPHKQKLIELRKNTSTAMISLGGGNFFQWQFVIYRRY